jgi:hypothetical protein
MMQSNVQVFKRPMTVAERASVNNLYAQAQKGARIVGGLAIGFAIFGVFMSATMGSDEVIISILFAALMVVFGIMGLGVTFSMFKMRKTIVDVQRSGSVVTVRGPAVEGTGKQSWSVGPLAMKNTPETVKVPPRGTLTELVCVPRLKSVISMNGVGLQQAIGATVPRDLEAMATTAPAPAPSVSVSAASPMPPASYAPKFCPSCGTAAAGTPFCPQCGSKL